jgi:hypothetical protein
MVQAYLHTSKSHPQTTHKQLHGVVLTVIKQRKTIPLPKPYQCYGSYGRANGSEVGLGTMLQAGKLRARFPMLFHFSIHLMLPDVPWPCRKLNI